MKKPIQLIFEEIEKSLLNSLNALEIAEDIYSCGFWLFYCDYTVIHPPCFGYNTSYEHNEHKWNPAEWEVDVHDGVYNALSPFYEKISHAMNGAHDDDWNNLVEYQWDFYSKICYKLNSTLDSEESPLKKWPKSHDFVIGIFEQREGEEIYRKLVIDSLGYEKAKKLCAI